MKRLIISVLSTILFVGVPLASLAQSAPPSYQGDPDVYKVIFEDANFRVISINRGKGVTDKPHGHPAPGVIYHVTDCSTKLHSANGQTRDAISKAGTANATPIVASHTAENTGSSDCHQIIVEKK